MSLRTLDTPWTGTDGQRVKEDGKGRAKLTAAQRGFSTLHEVLWGAHSRTMCLMVLGWVNQISGKAGSCWDLQEFREDAKIDEKHLWEDCLGDDAVRVGVCVCCMAPCMNGMCVTVVSIEAGLSCVCLRASSCTDSA